MDREPPDQRLTKEEVDGDGDCEHIRQVRGRRNKRVMRTVTLVVNQKRAQDDERNGAGDEARLKGAGTQFRE
jgi:hypothetical protein